MTPYQLWFRFGAPNKTPIHVLVPVLEQAGLLTLTTKQGELLCELKTTQKTPIHNAIKAYKGRSCLYRLYFYYKAAKRWKHVLRPSVKGS